MPLFSVTGSKRFMVENFGQYLGDSVILLAAGSPARTPGMLDGTSQPLLLLNQLLHPTGADRALPARACVAVPVHPVAAAKDTVAAGRTVPAGIVSGPGPPMTRWNTIRYTLLVVPGFALGVGSGGSGGRRSHPWDARTRSGAGPLD